MPYDDEDVRAYYAGILPTGRTPTKQEYRLADQATAWWFDASAEEIALVLEQ